MMLIDEGETPNFLPGISAVVCLPYLQPAEMSAYAELVAGRLHERVP